jgi:hypothetical protein
LVVLLLFQAARDPEPLVRRLCAEVAAELPALAGTQDAPGFPVLRLLVSDSDPSVKNRAAALLSRVGMTMAPPSPENKAASAGAGATSVVAPPPELPKEPEQKPAEPVTPEPLPGAEAAAGQGTLLLEAPEGALYQIDEGKWQTAPETGKPISLPQGEHRVTTLGGQYKVQIDADKKARLKLAASPVEDAVQTGSRAYQQKDYGKALKQYDRAVSLCSRDRTHKKACTTLELGLALDRGRSFEAQKRYSEAMAEYQKAVDGGRGKVRVQAAEAMSRLQPQLGKVILHSLVKGKCQERVQWLLPGRKQKIKVGNKSEPVNVTAGKTVEVGACP